jgi:hypothetical protein
MVEGRVHPGIGQGTWGNEDLLTREWFLAREGQGPPGACPMQRGLRGLGVQG